MAIKDLEFNSLGAVAIHARHLNRALNSGITRGLQTASRRLLYEVKSMFGHYQEGAGPFPNWQDLADSTLSVHAAFSMGDTPLLLTGSLMRSYNMEVKNDEAVIGSDDPRSLILEVGGEGGNGNYIPGRSTLGIAFIRAEKNMFERYERELELWFTAKDQINEVSAIALMDRGGNVDREDF